MDTSVGQGKPVRKYNGLAVASFALGLLTAIFPIVSTYYLITANGGPGYLQSLFCGVPVTFASLITGIVSLLQIRGNNQPGPMQVADNAAWMAVVGIAFGILFIIAFSVMVAVLILPFLFSTSE